MKQYGNKDMKDLWRALDQVPASMSYITRLKAFSLSLHWSSGIVAPKAFWIPHSTIHNIVKQLPLSLRCLEIDLESQERTASSDVEMDICEAVATTLPHLEHVRLRLARYCAKLFVPSETHSKPW